MCLVRCSCCYLCTSGLQQKDLARIATTSSAAQPSPPQALFVSVRVPWLGSGTILILVIESPASTSLYPQSPAAFQPAYATSSDAVAVSPAFEGASFVFVTVYEVVV